MLESVLESLDDQMLLETLLSRVLLCITVCMIRHFGSTMLTNLNKKKLHFLGNVWTGLCQPGTGSGEKAARFSTNLNTRTLTTLLTTTQIYAVHVIRWLWMPADKSNLLA